jgi:hypothetical protein
MKKLIIIVAVIAALTVSAFFGISALAAGNQAAATPLAGTAGNGTPWSCPFWGNSTGPTGTYINPELQRIAGVLGLTPEELTAQLQAGKTLAQIAETKNITRQSLLEAMMAPAKDQLQLDVKYGYRTQAQADIYLQQETGAANDFMDQVFTNTNLPGQGYGWGMMGSPNSPGTSNPGTSQTPSTNPSPGGYSGRGMMGGGMMRGW